MAKREEKRGKVSGKRELLEFLWPEGKEEESEEEEE